MQPAAPTVRMVQNNVKMILKLLFPKLLESQFVNNFLPRRFKKGTFHIFVLQLK